MAATGNLALVWTPMPHHSDHPRYITTIDRGFIVALPVAGKRAFTKTFREPAGDPEAQLVAAVAWRDRAWRRLFGETVPVRSFQMNARKGSSTGVPGVRYLEKTVRKGDKIYIVPCIVAEVHTIPGRDYVRPSGSRSRLWSLNKYEYGEAIALGAAWRSWMLEQLVQ